MELLPRKTLSCEDFFLTSFFPLHPSPYTCPSGFLAVCSRVKQFLLWLLVHTCWFCPFCPTDSRVDFSEPLALCKWKMHTLEEGSKGLEMHVDFHSPQETGLSVFFPLQLLHLSVGRHIFSPGNETMSKLVWIAFVSWPLIAKTLKFTFNLVYTFTKSLGKRSWFMYSLACSTCVTVQFCIACLIDHKSQHLFGRTICA